MRRVQRTCPAPGRLLRPQAALRPRRGLVAPSLAARSLTAPRPTAAQVENLESGGVLQRFLACSRVARAESEWGFSCWFAGCCLRADHLYVLLAVLLCHSDSSAPKGRGGLELGFRVQG